MHFTHSWGFHSNPNQEIPADLLGITQHSISWHFLHLKEGIFWWFPPWTTFTLIRHIKPQLKHPLGFSVSYMQGDIKWLWDKNPLQHLYPSLSAELSFPMKLLKAMVKLWISLTPTLIDLSEPTSLIDCRSLDAVSAATAYMMMLTTLLLFFFTLEQPKQ